MALSPSNNGKFSSARTLDGWRSQVCRLEVSRDSSDRNRYLSQVSRPSWQNQHLGLDLGRLLKAAHGPWMSV
jgi:hypothetical protein